jgi:hypothetical protein
MKTVAIIGAGPSGLVAAKTLLRSSSLKFKVTVFEKSDRIGGIWSVNKQTKDGLVPPNMPTNLSRFAVAFSDLAWESLTFDGKKAPLFPKAWQVNQYLVEYVRRYIPEGVVSLNTKVQTVERANGQGSWKIHYSRAGKLESETFDYCIVSSGFFSKPRPIRCELYGFENSPIKMTHSSEYRGLEDVLLPTTTATTKKGKKLLVIGGANSGGEVAAALAFDLSTQQHSPDGKEDIDYDIIHVLPRPLYGLPLFLPSAYVPGAFLPLDIRFYDLAKRLDELILFKFGKHTPETARMFHGMIQTLLGSDKVELGMQPLVDEHEGDFAAPYAAIQEQYTNYVRSGAITVKRGRVTSLHYNGNDSVTATIQSDSNETLEDIAGVIYATGYTPAPALNFLSPSIKQKIGYDPTNHRIPILLTDNAVSTNPALPDLGFVGFYEGPYWGVMEMQARHLAHQWSQGSSSSVDAGSKERLSILEDLRSAIKTDPQFVPQYVFSDYLAILEQSARELGLSRNDNGWKEREGPVAPSRYLSGDDDYNEAQKTMKAIQEVITSAEEGRNVARATFRGLQGNWKIKRRLMSKVADFPTGTFTGSASFYPRNPTDSKYDFEYLYVENGTLNTDKGFTMEAHRRYAYRYIEETDTLSVWFVKQDGKTIDYLYHDVIFQPPATENEGKIHWNAKADHLCVDDFYDTAYGFDFNGVAIENIQIKHSVKGPRKDYTSDTIYQR